MPGLLSTGNRFRPPAALLLAAALWPAPVAAFQDFDAGKFHAYVERAVADWDATGLAVAVVRGPELLFARGYGVLELGKPEAVDPDTLFSIGSTTKAMTAATLGVLVDEGSWVGTIRCAATFRSSRLGIPGSARR